MTDVPLKVPVYDAVAVRSIIALSPTWWLLLKVAVVVSHVPIAVVRDAAPGAAAAPLAATGARIAMTLRPSTRRANTSRACITAHSFLHGWMSARRESRRLSLDVGRVGEPPFHVELQRYRTDLSQSAEPVNRRPALHDP